jgi:hypothetical protein
MPDNLKLYELGDASSSEDMEVSEVLDTSSHHDRHSFTRVGARLMIDLIGQT